MRHMNQTPPPLLPQSNDDRRCLSRRSLLTALGLGLIGLGGVSAQAASARQADAYVSALKVREQTDGVRPFDEDDGPGNDSSATNLIVRSFDSVNYLLEYTTELTDKEHPVKGAVRLVATFTLPMDPRRARFDAQTLNWAVEGETTYVYADGTRSKTWDKSRTVTQQIFTAVRLLEGKGTDDRVPGAGQLSVGILVYAAVQGERILPTFALNVEGDSRRVACQPKAVAVSSRPRFNIDLQQGREASRNVRYVDWDAGTAALSDDTETLDAGRIYGDSLGIALRNTSVAKGMKGLELPKGDITFDVRLTATLDGKDATLDDEWGIFLWDYYENVSTSRGHLNRSMSFEASVTMPNWGSNHPENRPVTIGAKLLRGGVHNGGSLRAVQDAERPNVWHATVSGYEFDLDGFKFPQTSALSEAQSPSIAANVGYFHVSVFMPFARFPREVEGTRNYRVSLIAENFRATSESGAVVTAEEITSDNTLANAVTMYGPGTWVKYIQFSHNLYWSSAAAWAAVGGATIARHQASYSGAYAILDLDQLCKFDDKAFELTRVELFNIANASDQGTSTIWYAAKPDKSGWSSDDEMCETRVEHLVFYRTLEELIGAGARCVGILRELRDGELHAVRDDFRCNVHLNVRPEAEAGYVAQSVSDVRVWTEADGHRAGSVGDFDRGDGLFGVGDPTWKEKTYPQGYDAPWVDQFYLYKKTEYANGAIVGGHTGGAIYGDSCLLVGAKARVDIVVADKLADGSRKSTYDLDANERTATWEVAPAIDRASENQGSGAPGANPTGNAMVTVKLPADLHYVDGSCSLLVQSVTVNDDGTTNIVVFYESITAGEDVEPFTFATDIGAAGTDHDVDNNQQLAVEARITSDLDQRKVDKNNGNLSETAIVCVRLAAISVFKSVAPAHANLDEPHTWTLRFSNSSETDVTEVGLMDTMPYPGDDRGSTFFGTYTVRSLALDLTSAPKLLADIGDVLDEVLWITSDAFAREVGDDAILSDGNVVTRTFIGRPDRVSGGVLTWELGLNLSDIVAWGLVFDTMHGQEYLTVTLEVEPKGAASGDVYANSFTENALGQAAIVHSNVVKTDVESVSFTVEKVWDGVNGVTGQPAVTVAVIGSDGSETMLTCDEGDGWTASIEDLDRYAADGSRIAYTVEERDVPDGYELVGIEGSDAKGFRITNRALTGDSAGAKRPSHESWL